PFQPHCFAFGGFELQMIASMESARAAGADIAPLDFWRREADFDIVHFWGLHQQHHETAKWAHAAGKKVVFSALVNYPGWKSWLRHMVSSMVGPARLRRAMLPIIDLITVVNQAQAQNLVRTVGVAAETVVAIPNSVDDIFFETSGHTESGAIGIRNYVLCVGNICRRKNQLSLIKACRKMSVPLLLVGSVLTGEEDYGQAVAQAIAADSRFRWIRCLRAGSAELAAAYRGATIFALPSHVEQQPISALEAAAGGKALVLADRPYARQELYQNAVLANPRSVDGIARALREALDHPEKHCPPSSVIERCRRERVGAAYMAVYHRLI
ncbi:MAG: glycosyltransferase family 4 protein, partial [Candidatus Korobacteraceae bacterium]